MYSEEKPWAAITSSSGIYLADNPSLREFTTASGSIHPRCQSADSRVLSLFNSSWRFSALWCSAPCRDEAIAQNGYCPGLDLQFPGSVCGQGQDTEMKIQRRCVHDLRGSSGTSSSAVYIICGTYASLFNAGSAISTLHYSLDISSEFSIPLLHQLLYSDFCILNKMG